jgi:DegV family protein with EDD domain
MSKVAIITDSVACLTKEHVEQYGIRIIPINFVFEGKVYRDWIDVNPSQAYEFLRRAPESFWTSSSSPGDYLQAFREMSAQTDSILCIALSSTLSAMYNNAQVAKELARNELPNVKIEVIDSKTATGAQALIALAAARAAAEDLSLEAVVERALEVRDRVKLFILLETVRHVYRSGRIPKVASQMGSLLPVKPLLSVSEGAVHIAGVARTKQRGVMQLLRMMAESVSRERPIHVAVMHADVLQEGLRLKEQVAAEFNCVEVFLTEFSPVMGYATGRGVLGLAFYPETKV